MEHVLHFHVPSNHKLRVVEQRLRKRFPVGHPVSQVRRATYFDTFDWRLFRSQSYLIRNDEAGKIELLWMAVDGRMKGRLRDGVVPRFASDLRDERFRRSLEAILDCRRLLPLVTVQAQRRSLPLLNEDEKTVARILLEKRSATEPNSETSGVDLASLVGVMPVRGYWKACRSVVEFLTEDMALAKVAEGELSEALEAHGRRTADYSSRIEVHLDPQQRSGDAMRIIYQTLLDKMSRNETGLIQDWDPEFLHDFRVACRRTRSGLSQVRGALQQTVVARYRKELDWLGQVTGPCRDLDVLLLSLNEYSEGLPQTSRDCLAPLRAVIIGRRQEEHSRVVAALTSERYRDLVRGWGAFLTGGGSLAGTEPKDALRPILEIASRRIGKAYRRLTKRASEVAGAVPAELLHKIRIDSKKLRYLVEFFRSLYPEKPVSSLIRSLKVLQDELGEFQDYQVHQQMLRQYGLRLAAESKAEPEMLLALGQLLGELVRRQRAVQQAIIASLQQFCRPRVGKLIGQLENHSAGDSGG